MIATDTGKITENEAGDWPVLTPAEQEFDLAATWTPDAQRQPNKAANAMPERTDSTPKPLPRVCGHLLAREEYRLVSRPAPLRSRKKNTLGSDETVTREATRTLKC